MRPGGPARNPALTLNPAITLIAAIDREYAIGYGNAMPWHLPDDFKRFKQLTMGKPVLMGYRTAVSIGRALPDRLNLVLSRRHDAPFDGQVTVRSVTEAIDTGFPGPEGPATPGRSARDQSEAVPGHVPGDPAGADELMVGGGGEIYALLLPVADRLRLTWVDTTLPAADAYFPRFDRAEWTEVSREHHPADDRHAFAFDWADYERVK